MLEIDVLNIENPPYLAELENFTLKAMQLCNLNNYHSLELILTNNASIKELNATYRNKDEPTDVLSFSAMDEEHWGGHIEDENFLGTIIISLDMLQTNAEYFKVEINEEFKRLVVHGILHLQGYDHDTNNQMNETMLIKQEEILQKLQNYVMIKE